MAENEVNKQSDDASGLAQATVQLLAWGSLFAMFLVDKVLGMVAPPLPEYWYGAAFGVAISGKIASILMQRKG